MEVPYIVAVMIYIIGMLGSLLIFLVLSKGIKAVSGE